MRELDDLLLEYLEQRYDLAPEADKQAFRALLDLSGPELTGYLLQKEKPATDLARVVEHILGRTHT